jgi:hypothetical protein
MWLDPVRRALDAAAAPVDVFFRDDDAGWAGDALEALLDVFGNAAVPIDLAVIPMALSRTEAARLLRRRDGGPGVVGLHQHGCRHVNHEPAGRKCEFGPARPRAAQWRDLRDGRDRLAALLGPIDPIFTPPWNRCTETTVQCLAELGFAALSQDSGAMPAAGAAPQRLPVSVDWCRWRDGTQAGWRVLGKRLAASLSDSALPAGVMLHHAVMDDVDRTHVAQLLALLRAAPAVRCHSMMALVTRHEAALVG